MRITIRRGFGAPPEVHDLPWNGPGSVTELMTVHAGARFKSQTRPDEKPPDLPLIGFGAFDQIDRSGPGCRESNLHPEGLWALSYDFDDIPPDMAQSVLGVARSFSPEGFAHTTWQHGLKQSVVRMRVIMPLPRPVGSAGWPALWEGGYRELLSCADTQCKNIGRLYYLPAINLNAPAWAQQVWIDHWRAT